MIKKYGLLCILMIPSLLSAQTPGDNAQPEKNLKWKTTGLQQANTMGGGEAAISPSGKFPLAQTESISTPRGRSSWGRSRPPRWKNSTKQNSNSRPRAALISGSENPRGKSSSVVPQFVERQLSILV